MKNVKKILFYAIALAAVLWLVKQLSIGERLRNIFVAKEVVIDETPVVIKEIKSLGQLITYSSSDEVVVDSTIVTAGSRFINAFNRLAPFAVLPSADKRLVLIVRGKVLAGVDLAAIDTGSISAVKDTVTLRMPPPKIIDVIVNPGDFETFDESGNWTDGEATALKTASKRKLLQRAEQQQIVQKAGERAKVVVEQFLRTIGYIQVNFL